MKLSLVDSFGPSLRSEREGSIEKGNQRTRTLCPMTTSIGRKRTDIVFRYPQLLGNVKFAWGNSPRLHLPKVRRNLCLTNEPPIRLEDGSFFVNWKAKPFIPKSIEQLPPLIGTRSPTRITAEKMLEVKKLHHQDPFSYTVSELSRLFQISPAFVNMCIKKSKEAILGARPQ